MADFKVIKQENREGQNHQMNSPVSVLRERGRTELPLLLYSHKYIHSGSQQRTDQRVLTLKFLALNKTDFSPVKNTSQNFFDFFYLYSMQRFSVDATIFSKKF